MKIVRIGVLTAALSALPSHAQETELRDPWVPESAKAKRSFREEHATRGIALQAQVRRKLRETFDAADVDGAGSISQAQARAAGLGLIAREFEEIDVARRGRITFDDYVRFLRARGGSL